MTCDGGAGAATSSTRSRPFIFSTAPPPPAVAGALAALELLAEEPRRVERLAANARALRDELAREGFDVSGSTTQIVPLVIGDAEQAMRICELAIEHGVFAQAIRPPTVAEGTSRLRLAVMATHTKDELREAARVLGRAALQAGFRPGDGVPVAAARDGAARAPPRARPCAASSSRAPTPASARPSSPPRSPPRCAARGRARRAVKPVVTGLDEPEPGRPARPRAARRGRGRRAAARHAADVRPRRSRRTSRPSSPAARSSRPRSSRHARAAAARRRRASSPRASAACSSR